MVTSRQRKPHDMSIEIPRETLQYLRAKSVFTGSALVMLGLFLFTMLNAVLAGGQFGSLDSPKWDVAVPWAWIAIPAWLVIAVAVVPPIAAVSMARWVTPATLGDFVSSAFFAVAVFCVIPLILSTMYTVQGGTVIDSSYPDEGQGLHWLAAPIQIVTVGIIVVRAIVVHSRAKSSAAATDVAE